MRVGVCVGGDLLSRLGRFPQVLQLSACLRLVATSGGRLGRRYRRLSRRQQHYLDC